MTVDAEPTSTIDHLAELARVLTPASPPRIIEDVYTDDQHARILDVIRREGPWPSIIAHHFETVDEVIATTVGALVGDHGLTLDDIATAQFRGFLAENSVSYHPELDDIVYNRRFLDLAIDYWDATYAKPTLVLFNLCGPHESIPVPHLDGVTFRGVRFENTPVWMQNIMGKSGLFSEYLVKMAQVITWWYTGAEGTFTYWPNGPLADPEILPTPIWNRGVVVQNEMMFHRGDPVGRPDERTIDGLKHRSLIGYRPDHDDWAITTDDDVVRIYRPDEMRLLVHWNAEVYQDLDEMRRVMDHTDDLTHDQVVDTLLTDMRSKGRKVAEPSDPFHDVDFIQALMATYTIAPTTDWLTT